MLDDDLTALADLADVSAQGLLTRCPPEEWGANRVAVGLRFVAGRLRHAGQPLPASLVEVVEQTSTRS